MGMGLDDLISTGFPNVRVQLQCYICGTQTLSSGNYYFTEITTKCNRQDGLLLL